MRPFRGALRQAVLYKHKAFVRPQQGRHAEQSLGEATMKVEKLATARSESCEPRKNLIVKSDKKLDDLEEGHNMT